MKSTLSNSDRPNPKSPNSNPSNPKRLNLKQSLHLIVIGTLALVVGVLAVNDYFAAEDLPNVDVRRPNVLPASTFMNPDDSIDYYERAVRRAPSVVENHLALAQAYLQKAEFQGMEKQYVPRAEAAIDEALRRDPDNLHARILKARLLNKLHRFDEALPVAERILDETPSSSTALVSQIDALTELGRYDEAIAATDHLLSVRPGLQAYSRASYARELQGDFEGAMQAMELAVEAGVAGSQERAWALYHLGGLHLQLGELDIAEALYNGLLEERPDFTRARAGLAHIALLRGDRDQAADILEAAYAEDHRATHLSMLLEVYAAQNLDDAYRETVDRIVSSFEDARDRGENVRMEFADFLDDQDMRLGEALDMAAAEMKRRPNHRHAQETWAWTLHRNGRHEEAVDAIRELENDARGDAMLMYRAGEIHLAAGDTARGARLLREAVDTGLVLESPSRSLAARETLETIGQTVPAE